ncbi:MAG: hypothetical protein KatS3mg102_1978 [Planctomycetota bacterium]|nr:MAG: hypothetical protein KatS3mg102_1978 [Planctomycetota bacterium]
MQSSGRGVLGAVLVVALAAWGAWAPAARADGFIIVVPPGPPHPPGPPLVEPPLPPPPPREAAFPLAVKRHQVRVTIRDQHALTEVDQVFANPRPHPVEGTYLFPLPRGAAVAGFAMEVGGKQVQAELLEAERARELYTSIVRRLRDPALLEYADRGALRARIFPIPAHGEVRVQLRYEQVLEAEAGLVEYLYPLNTERFSARPLELCAIEVRLDEPASTVFSPSHPVEVERHADGTARVSWEAQQVLPDTDFSLLYQRRASADALVGISVVSHRQPGEDGWFMLLLDPDAAAAQLEPQPKDVVFVLDTSGSMAGPKLEQARAALRYCLQALDRRDRFALIEFATEARTWREELLAATPETVAAALERVDALAARGGTNLEGALRAALALPGAAERPFLIVLITDGAPTIGVTAPEEIERAVAQARQARPDATGVRLFCLGVGAELNVALLDRLAEHNRGARSYVGPRESIEHKVSAFFDKVRWPVLSGLEIELRGAGAHDLYPRPLPDLFKGGQLAVLGRYTEPGSHQVRVRGTIGGTRVEVVQPVELAGGARAAWLPRAHAVRKVAYLLDQMRLHGEQPELRAEVVRLAKLHGVVTPYTSYLIVEEEQHAAGASPGVRPHTAVRAIEELRRRAHGYGDAERAARQVIGGQQVAGADAAAASEALARLAGAGEAGGPPRPAAAPRPEEAAGLVLGAGGRFAPSEPGAAAQAEAAAQAVAQLVRVVAGRTFYRDGEVWVEAALGPEAAASAEKIAYLSDAYFELLARQPQAGVFLALGERVRFRLGSRVIEIVPAAQGG